MPQLFLHFSKIKSGGQFPRLSISSSGTAFAAPGFATHQLLSRAAKVQSRAPAPLQPDPPPASCSSLKSQVAPALNPARAQRFPCLLRASAEVDGRAQLRADAFSLRPPPFGNTDRLFFFFLTPRRMTASLKESGVSCVPHGAWGKEMIKAVRFPGSSRCLRWVLIWEESEERLGPVPLSQPPGSVWVADDIWAGWARAHRCAHSYGCRIVSCVVAYS
jgi:hypothetical protein